MSKKNQLYELCRSGNMSKLHELLKDNTINLDLQNKNGRTALHLACLYGHLSCAELLLENGANFDLEDNGDYNANGDCNDIGKTALECCTTPELRTELERIISKFQYSSCQLCKEKCVIQSKKHCINCSQTFCRNCFYKLKKFDNKCIFCKRSFF